MLVLILRMQGSLTSLPSQTQPNLPDADVSVFRFQFLIFTGLFSIINLLQNSTPISTSSQNILERHTSTSILGVRSQNQFDVFQLFSNKFLKLNDLSLLLLYSIFLCFLIGIYRNNKSIQIQVSQLTYILSLMNKNQPVQLRQKIDYLRQKIEYLNEQVKYRASFELKMKFIEFIDTTIQRVYQIQEKKQYSSQAAKSRYQEQYKSEENQIEKRRLEKQKQQMAKRLKELDQREKQIEVQSLKIELENAKVLKMGILKETSAKENQLKVYINELQKKIKAQEREIQKICKMNNLQGKEIQNLKEERNRAERRELQWKQKYDNDVGVLQAFNEKKNKYLYRNQQGLKITRSIVNATSQKKGCQRFFFCDLPLRFHIIKIAYGIKIGMINSTQQIEYFDEISLYEKEDMEMTYQEGNLSLLYIKRKVNLKLRYKPPKNQIVIMLFGKGDSVGLDQSR